MTKLELIQEIANNLPRKWKHKVVTRSMVKLVVNELCKTMIKITAAGEPIRIDGLATFKPVVRPAGRAYKYGTGMVDSREHVRIQFKTSLTWRDALRRAFEGEEEE